MPPASVGKPIVTHVAQALVHERLRKNISMNRLAEMTGLALTTISYFERGMRSPTLETVVRISLALDADLGAMLTKAIGEVRPHGRK